MSEMNSARSPERTESPAGQAESARADRGMGREREQQSAVHATEKLHLAEQAAVARAAAEGAAKGMQKALDRL